MVCYFLTHLADVALRTAHLPFLLLFLLGGHAILHEEVDLVHQDHKTHD